MCADPYQSQMYDVFNLFLNFLTVRPTVANTVCQHNQILDCGHNPAEVSNIACGGGSPSLM